MAIFSFITDPYNEYRATQFGKRAAEASLAGDFVRAENLHRKALASMERTPFVTNTVVYTLNLAEVFRAQKKYRDADDFYQISLSKIITAKNASVEMIDNLLYRYRSFAEEIDEIQNIGLAENFSRYLGAEYAKTKQFVSDPASEKPFQNGLVSFLRGEFDTAVSIIGPLAEQGHAKAQYILGHMHRDGEGVRQDGAEAARWYRLAAEQGYADAQYSLAQIYHEGHVIGQDFPEAAKWYRFAAELGNAEAQGNLGALFAFGQGVPQDYDQAMKWYRKSADQNTAGAQHSVGFMYHQGFGVLQDYDEAMKWYLKAAEGGHAEAQFNIGLMYLDGHGQQQDMVLSSMWFNVAVAFNHPGAARECLDSISREMTSDQIAEAQRLAAEWMAEHSHKERDTQLH